MFRNNNFVWVLALALLGLFLNVPESTTAFSTRAMLQRSTAAAPAAFSRQTYRPSRKSSSHLGSTVIERTEEKTVEILKDDKVEEDQKYGGEAYEIRLFNDPVNKREFVARCLSTICGKTDTESYQIMMEAHNNGYVLILQFFPGLDYEL
ncbi:MAG: hypothetical protein SGILL_000186 [Bacillariaceae sp.]